MRYTPFESVLDDIVGDDLAVLRNVHEGWYVDYKSAMISPSKIAKSLSSFANQHGGWVFWGIKEDGNVHVATSYPGLPNSEIPNALESIKNASKDLLNPEVYYTYRVFKGPIDSIGLPSDRSIIVVHIPEGADCPYIHTDGCIYRRIADSSDPKAETDQSRLNLLTERGNQSRSYLADLVTYEPTISKGEKHGCYMHLSILSDPYGNMDHYYPSNFECFSDLMSKGMLQFDNIYSRADGFIARMIQGQNQYNRVFTWEFSRTCYSFITYPIPQISIYDDEYPTTAKSISDQFFTMVEDSGLSDTRVLDLNQVLTMLLAIVVRHRRLVKAANTSGPFFVKAHLQNIWRAVPFIDLPEFMEHVNKYGLPVVQDDSVLVPEGTELNTFIELPEREPMESERFETKDEIVQQFMDIYGMNRDVFEAFGVPREIMNPKTSANLFRRYYNKPQQLTAK